MRRLGVVTFLLTCAASCSATEEGTREGQDDPSNVVVREDEEPAPEPEPTSPEVDPPQDELPPHRHDDSYLRGSTTLESVTVEGGIEEGEIQQTTERRLRALTRCYERLLRLDPTLEGAVTTTLHVDSTGRVDSATVSDDEMGVAAFQTCVVQVLNRLRFRETASESDATLRFRFAQRS